MVGQLVNAIASLAACVIWAHSLPSTMRIANWQVQVLTVVCILTTAWYSIVNFILVLEIAFVATPTEVIPLFRYAFPLVVVAPALRTIAYRPVAKQLQRAVRGDLWEDSKP